MKNQGRKTVALLIIVSAFYLAVFDWDWPSLSDFKFSWAYTTGITVAVFFCMAERYMKHRKSDFQWKKLLKTHFFAFLVFCPISVVMILPKLGHSNNGWQADCKEAFFVSFFFLTVGPKIGTIYERLEDLLIPKKEE